MAKKTDKVAVWITEKANRIARKIIDGLPTKYDPEKQIPILQDLFMNGDNIAAFCSEIEISRDTFYNWVNLHPEFAEAYKQAHEHAFKWYEMVGKIGIRDPLNFNSVAWSMQMRNRFGMADKRTITIKNIDKSKSFLETYALLMNEVANGRFTCDEVVKMCDVITKGVDIKMKDEMEKDVAMLKEYYLKENK
jgi:hypothetical protein